MTPHVQLIVFLLICFATVSTNADPSICYYCTTDADGTACNSPLNRGAIRRQFCGNFTVTDNTDVSPSDVESTPNNTFVCTTLTYTTIDNSFKTIRECQSSFIGGVEICSILQQSVSNMNAWNFNCTTCQTDLCNSATTVTLSSFAACVIFVLIKLMA